MIALKQAWTIYKSWKAVKDGTVKSTETGKLWKGKRNVWTQKTAIYKNLLVEFIM